MGHAAIASGAAETVLVIGAETLSRILDWTDRATSVLFGDAAAAVVLRPCQLDEGFLTFHLGSDGSGGSLICLPAGGSRLPPSVETVAAGDHYLKMNDTDWLAAYQKLMARSDSMMAAANAKTSASRKADSRPLLPLASYAGTYNDQWYGDIQVAQENGKLVITFTKTPSLVGDLEHWQYDTFVARWRDRELRADAFVTFSLRPDGTIREARMEAVSPETDFSFDFQDLLLKPVAKK